MESTQLQVRSYESVINPALYYQLRRIFKNVRIANQGEHSSPGRASGEYYCVCCPFCNDRRFRLWINHLWGVGSLHSDEGDRAWYAAVCYNEDCLRDRRNRQKLRDMVWSIVPAAHIVKDDLFRIVPNLESRTENSNAAEAISLPPGCVPVDQLPEDHPAVSYLRQRGFDVSMLSEFFGVSYCATKVATHSRCANRIIFPIWFKGSLAGWQARYLGAPANKLVPKYYTMPGLRKRSILYGYDLAKFFDFVIVVEGITDAIAVGPPAVALLGKTASHDQIALLSEWPLVVILLDGDAETDAMAIGRALLGIKHVICRLPDAHDPASLYQADPSVLWQLIAQALSSAGYTGKVQY